MSTVKKDKISINDLLQAIGDAQPAKKSKTGVVSVECSELEPKINTWLEGCKRVKEGEAMKAGAELSILPKAEKLRIEQSTRDGSMHASVKINDKIMATATNRYSAIPIEEIDTLRKEFGDRTEEYFQTSASLSLTAEALEDATVLAKLLKTFGKDDFLRMFDLKKSLKPTESFHKDRILNDKIKSSADKLIAEGIIKPAKLSIKSVE